MIRDKEIPVYLIIGFLDSGKTKFIQNTLESSDFDTGERTLLLVCEEGEEEYDPEEFTPEDVFIHNIEDEEELTEKLFEELFDKYRYDRILIEYNGMWMIDRLLNALPENFLLYQNFMFAEASTFIGYNSNMRQLVFDKLQVAEIVIFNRFPKDADIMPYHKIVRAVNRRCTIAYEHPDGKTDFDEIVDPLPFDKNADVIDIADRDYAIWYTDVSENMKDYDGKTVRFKAQLYYFNNIPAQTAAIGRQLMNCCAADIAFAGLIGENCKYPNIESGEWVNVTAKITVGAHPAYEKTGPVLNVIKLTTTIPPEEPVATFY